MHLPIIHTHYFPIFFLIKYTSMNILQTYSFHSLPTLPYPQLNPDPYTILNRAQSNSNPSPHSIPTIVSINPFYTYYEFPLSYSSPFPYQTHYYISPPILSPSHIHLTRPTSFLPPPPPLHLLQNLPSCSSTCSPFSQMYSIPHLKKKCCTLLKPFSCIALLPHPVPHPTP